MAETANTGAAPIPGPAFLQPIRNTLIWVYEGQTQYWDRVLSARSGLWTREHALAALADTAATHGMQAGSRWRPMSDTTNDPIIAARSELPWPSWQRSEDYYTEGALVWMNVDTHLRELTGDTRSLDEFARAFFARRDDADEGITSTHKFDDLVCTLNGIAGFDWSAFFIDKLHGTRDGAPLEGIARGGYRLVYRDTSTAMWAAREQLTGVSRFLFSLGLSVCADGQVREVRWESPAFAAAIITGARLLDVNGRSFTPAELRRAIACAGQGQPVELIVQTGKHQRLVTLDCPEGHRYPHLEPVPGARRRLVEILAPKRAGAKGNLDRKATRTDAAVREPA